MTRYFYLYDTEDETYLLTDEGISTLDKNEAKVFSDDPQWLDLFPEFEREYLPEDQQAKLNGHPSLFIIKGDRMMPATLDQRAKRILDNVAAAKKQLEELQHKIDYLNSVGRYPAEAKEYWQSRKNSEKKYLYMRFRRQGDTYLGPDGKSKVYIGSEDDAASIVEARRLNRNYRTWRLLDSERIKLKNWIINLEYDLKDLERSLDAYLERSERIPPMPDVEILTPEKLPGLENAA